VAKKETKKVESKNYKVISPFKDKYTEKLYNIGDTYETDDKRAVELNGYIEEVKTDE